MTDPSQLDNLLRYPLMSAIFGRRARRFGMGMEIVSGPLAFKSGPTLWCSISLMVVSL